MQCLTLIWQLFSYPEMRIDGRQTSLPLRKTIAALNYVVEAQTAVFPRRARDPIMAGARRRCCG